MNFGRISFSLSAKIWISLYKSYYNKKQVSSYSSSLSHFWREYYYGVYTLLQKSFFQETALIISKYYPYGWWRLIIWHRKQSTFPLLLAFDCLHPNITMATNLGAFILPYCQIHLLYSTRKISKMLLRLCFKFLTTSCFCLHHNNVIHTNTKSRDGLGKQKDTGRSNKALFIGWLI